LNRRLRFGHCELWPQERLLLVDGRMAPIGARAFDVLLALVEHRDRVVGKSELLDLAWPGLVVEENNLTVQISALRKVLGPLTIATIPLLGYRFAASVTEITAALQAAVPEPPALPPAACVLCALDAGAGAATNPTERAGRAVVDAHGGRLLAAPRPGALLAMFPSARAAATAADQLHGLQPPDRSGLQIALQGPDPAHADTPQQALRLALAVPAGQTWASVGAAAALVHTLDGDIEDLGRHDGPDADKSSRVFRVTAPPQAGQSGPPPTRSDLLPTLAVIPFGAYARESETVCLGDVIADQVISALSRSHSLHVISRLSTLAFRDRSSSAAQIGRSLAADFVVSGRYLVAGDKVQLHVELAEASGSRVLWADTVVDHQAAALQADSQLVQALVSGITQAVLANELRLLRSLPLPGLSSHTLLLAGINLMYRLSPREFDLARQALETVRERAPRHAAPLAWLARWHLFRVVQGWSQDRDADGRLALELAQRALDLDADSSLALTMLGNVNTSYLRDLDRAESLYDQALAVNPNESLAWLQKGNARSFRGDGEAALQHVQRAVSLSPLDPARHYYLSILASAALSAQSFELAIDAARQSLRLNREHVSTHRVLAIAQSMTGNLDAARTSVREVLRLEPQLTVARFVARSPGAQSGLAQTFGAALHAAGLPLDDDDPTQLSSNGG
jgi:DNA-binding winged helix-turn-helix (wHTH) protein/TolB-like protein/Flp pilus assembly protein TadD